MNVGVSPSSSRSSRQTSPSRRHKRIFRHIVSYARDPLSHNRYQGVPPMHTLSRKVLTLAALALFSAPAFTAPAFAAPAEAGAQSGIPSGRYTLLLTGALVGPNFASRKTTTIGVVVFDANGNYTGHIDTNETRGTFQNVTITGTYARQANGVGSLSWNAQGFGQFQFQAFYVANFGISRECDAGGNRQCGWNCWLYEETDNSCFYRRHLPRRSERKDRRDEWCTGRGRNRGNRNFRERNNSGDSNRVCE